MNLTEKYQAEIAKVPEAEVTENTTCLYVTAGTYARLRVDKVSVVSDKLKVQVSWTSIGMVSPAEAIEFAARVTAISALAETIEKGEAL
jgi:hypothetical protein